MSITDKNSNGSNDTNEQDQDIDCEDKHIKYARIMAKIARNPRFNEVIQTFGSHGVICHYYQYFYPDGDLKE